MVDWGIRLLILVFEIAVVLIVVVVFWGAATLVRILLKACRQVMDHEE